MFHFLLESATRKISRFAPHPVLAHIARDGRGPYRLGCRGVNSGALRAPQGAAERRQQLSDAEVLRIQLCMRIDARRYTPQTLADPTDRQARLIPQAEVLRPLTGRAGSAVSLLGSAARDVASLSRHRRKVGYIRRRGSSTRVYVLQRTRELRMVWPSSIPCLPPTSHEACCAEAGQWAGWCFFVSRTSQPDDERMGPAARGRGGCRASACAHRCARSQFGRTKLR